MWYIVPSFIHMDRNMYSMYYLEIEGLYPLSFRKKKGYVIDVIQLEQVPPIE